MAWSHLVFPDTHGEYERVAHVINETEAHIDTYIFAGDVIDGPDSRRLISLIRTLGERAITIVGNHEWVCRNALDESGDPTISVWRDDVWPKYELDMLASYGIKRTPDWFQNAERLRNTMREQGDLEWLRGLRPYFETDTFVALHAGPQLDKPWSQQAMYLDAVDKGNSRLYEEPPQLFNHKLAQLQPVRDSVSIKTFVTGHDHSSFASDNRVAEHRVCLGSRLGKGDPLFVWDAATKQVMSY